MIKIVKGVIVTLSATLLLTACSGKQENVNMTYSRVNMATDATASEIKQYDKYVARIKKTKKRKKFILKQQKQKIDLKKFCFKDSRSIHYRAEERCEK